MPYVFTLECQKSRRLSVWLRQLVERGGLRSRFFAIDTVEELDHFERELPAALARLRPEVPFLGGDVRAWQSGTGHSRPIPGTNNADTMYRHYIAIPIEGDASLVEWWPDSADDELTPVDAEAQAEAERLGLSTIAVRHRLYTARETWKLVPADPPTVRQAALHTFVELSRAEERQVRDGEREIQSTFDQRIAEAHGFVARVATQTEEFFEIVAPDEFAAMIADRREELINRSAVTASLSFPEAWRAPAPTLVVPPVDAPAADRKVQQPVRDGLRVEARPRLAEASFADVQRVVRIWANSIERYPDAYTGLVEDRVSDLLAATLNATLPGAQREVYSRSGKSDIFVQADVLAEGSGPAKVFICEAKWATDDSVVTKAVDPQLFGYLNTHDTAAVLLLLFRQIDFDTACERRLDALRSVNGFVGETPGPSGWPILEFRTQGRRVNLCVATVHVPPRLSGDGTV